MIRHRRPARAVVSLALLALGGCAGIDTETSFADVQQTASARLGGKELRWNRGTAEDAQAAASVKALLESPLTADAAVQVALLNNRRLQAAYEELGIAQADLVQAGLLENPVFSSSILVVNGLEPTLSVVQNFLDVLTLSARRTVAESDFARVQLELGHAILDLAAEVRAAYYGLVADEQAVELFRQVTAATEAAAELAQRQVAAGNASPRDQALQQAQYARAALDLARAETELAADRERLNRLLGLWGDQVAWNLPERLPDPPPAKPALDGLEALAVSRRLDLAAARKTLETAGYAADLTRSTRFLNLVGLGYEFERKGESGKWLSGPVLEFSLPVFDQGEARIARAEAERRRRGNALAGLAVDVRSEVREAWSRLVAAQDVVAHYRNTVLPLQQRIVAEDQRLYNGMLIGVYDLLRSRQDQIDAARAYIDALKEYWVARAALEKALAGPLPGAPSVAAEAEERAPHHGAGS